MTRDELREWLDRGITPRDQWAHVDDDDPSNDMRWRSWPLHWRAWFHDGEYLGESSARTGPDPTDIAQRCAYDVCVGGRTAKSTAAGGQNSDAAAESET